MEFSKFLVNKDIEIISTGGTYSNYHTHCMFCDGKGDPEDYIRQAISLNFKSLGFSSHAPVHVPNDWTMKKENLSPYLQRINSLKEKYRNKIEIYCGLEIDYFRGISGPDSPGFKELNLDYSIGSVHFIRNENTGEYLTVDGDEAELKQLIEVFFNGDVKALVAEYYSLVQSMLLEHKPDIVGHLDLIMKNNKDNKYFNPEEEWYKEQVIKTLEVIKNSGAILEVNTGAMVRRKLTAPYPSYWILEKCCELNIPITLSSDAHSPENLDAYFEQALNLIECAGYKELYEMKAGSWRAKEI